MSATSDTPARGGGRQTRFFKWAVCAGLYFVCLSVFSLQAADEDLWQLQLGTYYDSCAAIDQNGTIYVTASGYTNYKDFSGGKLVAVSSAGNIKWEYKTFSDIKSSPAVADDGTIYFGCRDKKLHAISAQGKAKWSFATGGWIDSSPAIATNGVICFGSWDKKFYALNSEGSRKWEFKTDGPIDSSPAIATDGTIYFGSHDKKMYALAADGAVKWVFATKGAIISSPALNCDGSIYFTSVDGFLYVLKPDGTEKWHVWTGGVRESSPVIDADGNIYLGVNNEFRAYKPDGTQKWYFGYPVVDGAAAIAADGTVYFGGVDGGSGVGSLYEFSREGQFKPYRAVAGPIISSPAIAGDGTIYIGGYGFRALKGSAGLAGGCWPKFRGNAAQTGRMKSN